MSRLINSIAFVVCVACGNETGFFDPQLISYSAEVRLADASEIFVFGEPGAIVEGGSVSAGATAATVFKDSFVLRVPKPQADSLALTWRSSDNSEMGEFSLSLANTLDGAKPMIDAGALGDLFEPAADGSVVVNADKLSQPPPLVVFNRTRGAVAILESGTNVAIAGETGDTLCIILKRDGQATQALCEML